MDMCRVLCVTLIALGSACGHENSSTGSSGTSSGSSFADPRIIIDACGLPTPCGRVHHSDTSNYLEPFEDAACIYTTLGTGQPAHFTVELSVFESIFWDLYVNGKGQGILITSHCALDGPCTEYKVESCTLRPREDFECSGSGSGTGTGGSGTGGSTTTGGEPSMRACEAPPLWCTGLAIVAPACP